MTESIAKPMKKRARLKPIIFEDKTTQEINNEYLKERRFFVHYILNTPEYFHIVTSSDVVLVAQDKEQARPVFIIKHYHALHSYTVNVARLNVYLDYLFNEDPDNYKEASYLYRRPIEPVKYFEKVTLSVSSAVYSAKFSQDELTRKINKRIRQIEQVAQVTKVGHALNSLLKERTYIASFDYDTVFRYRYCAGATDTVARLTYLNEYGSHESENIRVIGTGLPLYYGGDPVTVFDENHNLIVSEKSSGIVKKEIDKKDCEYIVVAPNANKKNAHLKARKDLYADNRVKPLPIKFISGTKIYLESDIEIAKNKIKIEKLKKAKK